MKVLIVGPVPPPIEGCSNANKVLYKNLITKNVQCDVINTNSNILTNEQGRKFSLKKAFYFFKNYKNLYSLGAYDLIYFTPGQTFYGVTKYAPFILASLYLKKPYIIHVHGNFLGTQYSLLTGLKKKIFHFLVSRAAAGIVITDSLKENFKGLLSGNKVFVVTNFVEDELYEEVVVKNVDKLRVLYLSNLMREKGIIEFLDALIELDKKHVDFEAYVAGAIEAGLEDEVKSRFDLLKEKLTYFGIVTGIAKLKLLNNANVFVLPTYYAMEGLPISILEAVATGNIIVSTEHAGIADTVSNLNGFLIEKKSSKAIVACLEHINASLEANVNRFSRQNFNYARTAFTEQKYSDNILNVMSETVR
ncbi:glycosyltransferase involved in cell wall biosynthesis [Pontibacter ummariensis]|uniref:Glycosyltransferase involved in cell wall bisynthesis n=1 Tax=Pontibacter ummariensis TaxID=1610492 RepID=A0A239K5K8_9BACT|nr:glycosyltransferase family 4 protein [Pontibacter ummariensis]PRY06755.1 glycosyltransferase involved in cell wall biosynthesis [Pontibacter ummariensis]SNT13240.1 Glycosyltransferase involved in cell wall bisynthesis [Pontibacter ummariensis]